MVSIQRLHLYGDMVKVFAQDSNRPCNVVKAHSGPCLASYCQHMPKAPPPDGYRLLFYLVGSEREARYTVGNAETTIGAHIMAFVR